MGFCFFFELLDLDRLGFSSLFYYFCGVCVCLKVGFMLKYIQNKLSMSQNTAFLYDQPNHVGIKLVNHPLHNQLENRPSI